MLIKKGESFFQDIISAAVKGFILVAKCFILIARKTQAIAIATPTPNRMLNVTGLG